MTSTLEFETYAYCPLELMAIEFGLAPTVIVEVMVLVAVEITPTALTPFNATRMLEPSGVAAMPTGTEFVVMGEPTTVLFETRITETES